MGRGTVGRWAAVVGTFTLVWGAVLVALALGRYGGDARGFLYAGAAFSRPAALADAPVLSPYGYDGQFYAVLATDPLLLRRETRTHLDAPAYRAARVGAPLLAWLAGLGQPRAAVWMYLWACWLGALATTALVAAWLIADGRSPWWALLVGLSGGVAASLLRATPDALALAWALGGLTARRRGSHDWAWGLLAAAALTRETMLLVALGAAVGELAAGRRRQAALYALFPAGAYAAWRGVVALLTGDSSVSTGSNLTVPFAWVGPKLSHLFSGGAGNLGMELWGVLGVLAACGGAVVLARRAWREAPAAAYVFFAILAVLLSRQVMVEAYAYSRVLLALPVLGVVAATSVGPLARLWLYFLGAFQAVVGVAMVRVELGLTFPALANLGGFLP